MGKIKVCLIDDQEIILNSLKIIIEGASDIKVLGMATNGFEGIEMCGDLNPDIVLVDLNMQIMDGVETIKRIKRLFPEIKVIIHTTFLAEPLITQALQIGAKGYILKGVQPDQLIKGIKAVFNGGVLVPKNFTKDL